MYNANPNYEMDFMILKDVNEHMEGLFQRFSKLGKCQGSWHPRLI